MFFPLASFNKWCLLVVACQIFSWWSSKLCHRQPSTGSEVGRIVVDLVGSAVCTCVHQVFGILCPPLPSDLSWCRCLENRTLLFLPLSHVLSLTQKGSGQKIRFFRKFPYTSGPSPLLDTFRNFFGKGQVFKATKHILGCLGAPNPPRTIFIKVSLKKIFFGRFP